MARLDHCAHGRSYTEPCPACIEAERHLEDAHQRRMEALLDAETDWLSDPDDHLTQVFPDGFSAPCERCDGPSLGGRWCPSCETDLEARES